MSLLDKIKSFMSRSHRNMVIVPFTSVGNLLFTDSRRQIRKKLNCDYKDAKREYEGIKYSFDYFEAIDIKVGYDENDNVEAIEFFIDGPSPIFNGLALLTESFANVVNMFSELDPEFQNNNGEFTSNKYGIGGMIDYSEEPEIASANSIIIIKKGYYDKLTR